MRRMLLAVALTVVLSQAGTAETIFRQGLNRPITNTLLSMANVRKAIGMTDGQAQALDKADREYGDASRKSRETKDDGGFGKALDAHEVAVTEVKNSLTAGQKKRLLGIEVQVCAANKYVTIFRNSDVVKALELTAGQKAALKKLLDKCEKDAQALYGAIEKGDARAWHLADGEAKALSGKTFDKILATLSEKQRETLKQLQGERVEGITLEFLS